MKNTERDYYDITHECEQHSTGHIYLTKSQVDECADSKPLLVQCRACVRTTVIDAGWVKQQPVVTI
jgi:hypothetical protein